MRNISSYSISSKFLHITTRKAIILEVLLAFQFMCIPLEEILKLPLEKGSKQIILGSHVGFKFEAGQTGHWFGFIAVIFYFW